MDLFVDKDGMLKPESAKLVALAIYGEQAINSQSKKASNKAETKTKEEILKRVSTTEEKKAEGAAAIPSSTGEKQLKEFQDTVIPGAMEQQENPFLKSYSGEK